MQPTMLRRAAKAVRSPRRAAGRLAALANVAVARARTRLRPRSLQAWEHHSRACRRAGRMRAARDAAARLARLAPTDLQAIALHAELLEDTGDRRGVVAVWRAALTSGSVDAALPLRELLRLGDDAVIHEAGAASRPGADPAVQLLREVSAVLEERAGGIDALAEAAGAVADPALRGAVASRLVRAGLFDAAWTVLARPAVAEISDAELSEIVSQLTDPTHLEAAIRHTSARIQAAPHDEGARSLHRAALIARGKLALTHEADSKALRWFERAEAEAGPTPETRLWAGRTLAALEEFEAALDRAESGLAEAPDWSPLLALVAGLHEQLGNHERSVTHWRRLLDEPSSRRADLERAWRNLDASGEAGIALQVAQRLTEEHPGDAKVAATLGVSLHTLGREEQAEEAVRELRTQESGEATSSLAWYEARRGEASTAMVLLERLPPEEQDPRVWGDVIQTLLDDGHLDLARATAARAVARFPQDQGLEKLRRRSASEQRVLSGTWSPPPLLRASRPQPVPGRVLHVVGRSLPHWLTGYTVRTGYTVTAQRAVGIDAHVVTQLGFPWNQGRTAPPYEEVEGVPHHRLPSSGAPIGRLQIDARLDLNVMELAELVERLRPAVLHAASDFHNALIALGVGEQVGLPVVYEMRGFWEETWLANRAGRRADHDAYRYRRDRELEAAQRATHVVTLAETMRTQLADRGIDPEKVTVVPNAVDPSRFQSLPRDLDLAGQLGIDDETTVVGYVSSLVPYEGVHVLIDAMAKLAASGRPVKCLLVGDGAARGDLERQAAQLDLEGTVVFTGRVPHASVGSYYGLIDVFVVPRTNDRVCHLVSPLKPYEAMAAGCALVVAGTEVLRSMVDDGATGMVFEPENPSELADRIGRLADEPELRRRLADAARRKVVANHTWERNAQRYLELYRRLGVA